MLNPRQMTSHSRTKTMSAANGCAISAATRDQRRALPTGATASEDEPPDAACGILEFMSGLHVEVARAGQRNINDFCHASRPCRHHDHAVCEQDCLRDRVGNEQDRL